MLETTERERWRSAVLTLRTTETADFQRRERERVREREGWWRSAVSAVSAVPLN